MIYNDYYSQWPKIERAVQSPSLGILNYPLESHGGRSVFLLKFMTLPVHRALQKLILSFNGSYTAKLKFSKKELQSPHNYELEQHHATALFASTYLSKGLVHEVQVRLEIVLASQLRDWQPERLQDLVLGSNTGDALIQGLSGGREFLQFIYRSLGPAVARRIRITADIAKSDSSDTYSGSVTYKLAQK